MHILDIKNYINAKKMVLEDMNKKVGKGNSSVRFSRKNNENGKHLILRQRLTLGQKATDKITKFCGSWKFIIIFFSFLIFWIIINSILLIQQSFDPFPYILLNVILSTLAAVQAPIILMSQNRQTERDRQRFEYDYQVNRKAEREIQLLQRNINKLEQVIKEKEVN